MHILYADLSLSYSNDKENLFHNQELLQLVIISFSLKTLNVFIQGWYSKEKFNTGCPEGLTIDRIVLKSVNLTSIGIKARYDVSP